MSSADDQTESEKKPTVVRRYGLDPEDPNDDREWQMSPFSKERYELDEIQRAEKKGLKGKQELEELKKKYASKKTKEPECPPCPKCKEREEAESAARSNQQRVRCSSEYLYQPYGPSVVSSLSCSKPVGNRPNIYNILGPSHYSGYRMKVPAPSFYSTIPCSYLENSGLENTHVYVPYGTSGELRFTGDQYIPMGPTLYPVL